MGGLSAEEGSRPPAVRDLPGSRSERGPAKAEGTGTISPLGGCGQASGEGWALAIGAQTRGVGLAAPLCPVLWDQHVDTQPRHSLVSVRTDPAWPWNPPARPLQVRLWGWEQSAAPWPRLEPTAPVLV